MDNCGNFEREIVKREANDQMAKRKLTKRFFVDSNLPIDYDFAIRCRSNQKASRTYQKQQRRAWKERLFMVRYFDASKKKNHHLINPFRTK